MVDAAAERDHRPIARFDHRPPGGPPWSRWSHDGHLRGRRRGRLLRPLDGRLLGGVAGALSARTGFDVTIVRAALVVLSLASGVGVAAYTVAWLVLPGEGDDEGIAARARSDGRGLAMAVAVVPFLAVVLLVASAMQAPWLGSLAWPSFITATGLVLIWRNGSDAERLVLRQAVNPIVQLGAGSTGGWRRLGWRAAAGAVLAVAGVRALTVGQRDALLRPLGGIALVMAGVLLVFGPWWLNVGRNLVLERQARLRAEERAELASRIHDSVLQTLAMIQRHSGDPARVSQLARRQERELRSWLFEGASPAASSSPPGTFAAAVRRIQSDIEADHGVAVEVVVVGDAPLDPALEAMVAAGREATVNAAKWSGAYSVSLFAEVEADRAALYVRDRGRGFDREDVAGDRRGISQSIEGRMARAGGSAQITSAPGRGTEVVLAVPRSAGVPHGRGQRT